MQICQYCGSKNPKDAQHCSRCGQSTAAIEANNDPSSSGLNNLIPKTLDEKIKAVTGPVSGQRRLVTVLDVHSRFSSSPPRTFDEEAKYLLTRELVQLLSQVADEYAGHVDQISDQGMRVLFGAPIMVEDHAERAIQTALSLQNKLLEHQTAFTKKYGAYLDIRMGINTGYIIIGTIGSDAHKGYTVVGDTVKAAAALAQSSEVGSILVSESTYQLTQTVFAFRTIPTTSEVNSNLISTYEPLALREKPGGVRGLPGMQVPMIGREEAIAQLFHSCETVCRNKQGKIVLITGEAGVGKSRLLLEFRNSLSETDFFDKVAIYEGNCLAHTFSRPYWVVASVLRHIAEIRKSHSPETQLEYLTVYLKRLGLNHDNVKPFLVYLLGLEQVSPKTQQRIRLYDADMLQNLIHNAVRQVFEAAASQEPIILIFEDLHWSDAASWALLNYLAISAENMPILLILTSREMHSDQFGQSAILLIRLHLQALSFEESQLLAHQIINQSSSTANAVELQIAQRAGGNPFYLEEIIRMLIDSGGIIVKDGSWQVTAKAESLLQNVPGTLQALILTRFDNLESVTQLVLQKAAVLGVSFSAALLQTFDDVPIEAINGQLQHLVMHQFLIDDPTSGENTYTFRHTLVQDAIYGTLLRRHRKRLHGQIALTLERHSDWLLTERDQLLAYHYSQSQNPDGAIPYLLKIADDAANRFANETAVQYYLQTETLIDNHVTGYNEVYFRTKIGLGKTLKFLGDYERADELLSETLQALLHWSMEAKPVALLTVMVSGLREIADIQMRKAKFDSAIAYLEAGIESLGDNGAESYPILYRSLMERSVFILFRQGRLDEAFDLAQIAITDVNVETVPDPVNLANIYNTLGGIAWQHGDLENAINHVNQSLKIYEALDYSWGTANVYNNLGILTAQKGDWFQTADYWERALSLRKDIGDLQNQTFNLLNLGQLRLQMGNFSDARQDLENALTILHKLDDSFGIAHADTILAHIALMEQKYALASQHIQIAIELADAVGAQEIQVEARWIQAQILLEQGELQESLEKVSNGLRMAKHAGSIEAESDCLRVLGMLHLKMGNFVVAETHFRESIEFSRQINSPYRQALGLLEMGLIYQTIFQLNDENLSDWYSRSETALVEALDIFTSLGASYSKKKTEEAIQFLDLNKPQAEQTDDLSRIITRQDKSTGQRHTAAILRLNITLPANVDDETVFEVMTFVLPVCATIAQEYDGHVKQSSQGLIVAFGVPTTYEDDPERAVQAAHHMLQHLQQPEVQDEFTLSVQIVVTGGDVIAGQVEQGGQTELIFRGEPVDQAQQAVNAVPLNQVWVTDTIRKSTERLFTYHSQPQLDVIHIPLWQLVDLRESPDPARGMPGLQTRFLGRDSTLQSMLNLTQNLNQGIGGIIWIEGEAGIGKSRLMREFKKAISTEDHLIWEGRCSPQRAHQAFSLFTDLLLPAFNLQPNDNSDQIRFKIEQTFSTWPGDVQAIQPYMEVLAGIRPLGLAGERLNRLEPEQLRQQIFVAVRRLIKSLANEKPLIILLDDLHWIDPISAELLIFIVTAVTSSQIMFVCAQRREGSDSPNDRLVRLYSLMPGQSLRLMLDRLSAEVSQSMLDDLLPGAELPDEFRQMLINRSEGNPYFIEEFVRMLTEQGHVSLVRGNWQISSQFDYDIISIPSSLEILIRSRVDALPDELKQTIQNASIIGQEFEVELLAKIMNNPNVRLSVERLAQRLMFTPGLKPSQWQFSHALYESIVYNSMLETHRQTLHRNVAQALETLWADSENKYAKELAYHYLRADEQIKALPYLIEAGEQAAAQWSGEEALIHFQKASEISAQLPQPNNNWLLRIAYGLGDMYCLLGKYDASLEALEAGLPLTQPSQMHCVKRAELYRRMGETARRQGDFETAQNYFSMAQELIGEPDDTQSTLEMTRTHIGQAWIYFAQGQFAEALKAGKASFEYAEAIDNLNELAAAHNLIGGVHYHLGEWRDAFHHTTRAMVLREQMGYSWGVAGTLSNLGILAFMAGHWHKAISFFERSLDSRNEMGDVEGIAITQNNLGSAYCRGLGKFKEAEHYFKASVETAKTFNIAYHFANSSVGFAYATLKQGRIDEAQEIIESSIKQADEIGAKDVLAEAYRVQAEIFLACAAPNNALETATQAAGLADTVGNRSFEAAAWRVASESALALNDFDLAKQLIQKAETSLALAMDDLELGHVAAQAYRVYSLAGDVEQAEEKLREAREIYNRLGSSYFLNQLG